MSLQDDDVKMQPMATDQAIVTAPLQGDGATALSAATAPPDGASVAATTSQPHPASSTVNKVQQMQRLNVYFKTHNLAHNEQHRQAYIEYCKQHPGEEPPLSLFTTHPPAVTAGAPVLPDPSLFSQSAVTDVLAPTPAGVAAGSSPSSLSSGHGTSESSEIRRATEVKQVRTILRAAYEVLYSDSSTMRQWRNTEALPFFGILRNANSQIIPPIQHGLMSGRPTHPGGSGGAASGASSQDPRRLQQQQSGQQHPQMQQLTREQQAAYAQQQQQRQVAGAKRKDMGPSQISTNKFRRDANETSAAEARALAAAQQQAHHHGTPINASPPVLSNYGTPHGSPGQHGYSPAQPSSRARAQPQGPYPQERAERAYAAQQLQLQQQQQPVAPSSPRSLALARSNQLIHSWHQSKSSEADAFHYYLEPEAMIRKLGTIAADEGLSLPIGEHGLATVSLMTLATECFLKNILQSAHHVSRRRADLAKSYLQSEELNHPKRLLQEWQRTEEERKLRWAKHRELAEGDAKKRAAAEKAAAAAPHTERKELEKQSAAAAEKEAKLAAAIAEAEKMKAAASAQTTSSKDQAVEADYAMSLLLAPGGVAASANGPSTAPSASASSFLPPSTLPKSNFLPSSTLPTSGAGSSSSSTASSIALSDFLSVMEVHPQLRKSDRLYQSYLLLAAKKKVQAAESLQGPSLQAPVSSSLQPSNSSNNLLLPPSTFSQAGLPHPSSMDSLMPPSTFGGMPPSTFRA